MVENPSSTCDVLGSILRAAINRREINRMSGVLDIELGFKKAKQKSDVVTHAYLPNTLKQEDGLSCSPIARATLSAPYQKLKKGPAR